jgi:hypothetical protein
MPKTSSSIDKIRAELAWVTETPDPNRCGCRNLQCCEETGRKPGACAIRSGSFSVLHSSDRKEGLSHTDDGILHVAITSSDDQ